MKKFLSMVLALVMVMSLVTVSAGAKDFTDNDTITYDEAVAVVSEIGVVDGYTDGSFKASNTLTRQAAAKIICNLKLGPTTAAELHADTAPYRDVPANNEFAGYIAYCQKEGIISGYADGAFRPGNPLTGYAFMKMLLGALGYDATLEGYVGDNWSINVAKQAIHIGLEDGIEGEFNGIKPVNREEACLYAFNTLQADLVEYNQRLTTTINGMEVTLSSGGAQSRKWNSQQTRIDHIREDDIIQFAEEYFRKLEKKLGDDEFMRPAYTWIYDKEEIGTFVDWSLLVEEYNVGVSGRDMYDLLGNALLSDEDMSLVYYFNGVEPDEHCGMPSWVVGGGYTGDKNITKESNVLRRNNQNDVGFSGRGVLTQVFVDKDVRESIIITSIDTWLTKASADYLEAKESAPIEVWTVEATNTSKTYNVDVQDVPEIADVTEDTFYLANISFKDDVDDGEVVTVWEPEILEDSAVTKFSLPSANGSTQVPDKVTVSGTEYKKAVRGNYDPDALDEYNNTLLTDRKYNVILDQFGNLIGIELNEGAKNYVFITGFDRPMSNLSIKTADAAAIFLDGTMDTIKVNVGATDDNITDARAGSGVAREYFIPWQALTVRLGQDGFHALNRWFTYTKTESGVYTLKPATNMIAYWTAGSETIKTDNLYLDDNVMFIRDDTSDGTNKDHPYSMVRNSGPTSPYANTIDTPYLYTAALNARAYGNDDSVYITVETDKVDTHTNIPGSISAVTGVYTGVQSVEIELDHDDIMNDRPVDEAFVYAVYDKENYIIGAVTVGEGKGGDAIIAYVTDEVQSERIEDGYYYWEFEAIVDGEIKTLTAKEKYDKVMGNNANKTLINNEALQSYKAYVKGNHPLNSATGSITNWNAYDGLVELRMDADGYVVSVKSVNEKDVYSYFGNKYYTTNASAFKGGNSISSAANDYRDATFNATSKMDSIGDAKAYRVGVVRNEYMTNSGDTWKHVNADTYNHHYDSAPEVLKLVGHTLYLTADTSTGGTHPTPRDEGLALASDCKAFVIQRENGKWKTRDFTSVNAAVAQVVDADNNSANGKQFEGEVIAIMNGRAQASTVILISYTNMVSGSGNTPSSPVRVNNVAVKYVDPDVNGANVGGDEYTAFKLYNTVAGRKYTVTMSVTFGGLTTTRTKTVTGRVTGDSLYTGITDGFYGKLDTNTYITITCEEGVGTYVVPSPANDAPLG